MKKLISSALVAIVALGGALSVNAQYLSGSQFQFPCDYVHTPSCSVRTGVSPNAPLYANPGPGNQGPQIDVVGDRFYSL